MWPTETDYLWADGWEDLGFCLALVKGSSPEEVLGRMVPEPPCPLGAAPAVRAWAGEHQLPDYANAIEAGALDGWVVTFEANGFQATLDEVVARLSSNGQAVVVFRNVNCVMQCIDAVDGAIVRSFDPLLYPVWGGKPLPEESGLPFGEVGHPTSAAFAWAERLTGVHLTQAMLDARDAWVAVAHFPQYSVLGDSAWLEARANAERRPRRIGPGPAGPGPARSASSNQDG